MADFVRGITFKPEDVISANSPEGVACMRTKNVQQVLDTSDVLWVPASVVKRSAQYLESGDILISSANSWNLVGKCSWVPDLDAPTTFGGFVTALRADPSLIDRRYLYYWFSSPRVQHVVRLLGRRTTSISNLDLKRCTKLSVPLPSFEEQQRIVRMLDAADRLRSRRQDGLSRVQELRAALFVDAFGDDGQSPIEVGERLQEHQRGWHWELLTDVARLATGHTPDRGRPEYWNGGIPWITLTDIRELDGTVALHTSETVSREGIRRSSAVRLPPETVCFSRTASVGFVTLAGRDLATSQDFVNWVCGPSLEPTYLMHAFQRSRERLRALSTGSTHKTIYFSTVERFRVLVPPIGLQQEFASQVKALTRVKTRQEAHATELDALFASLQSRAFADELRVTGV